MGLGDLSYYHFITGVLVIIIGKVSDTANKKKMMIAGYSLNALFTFSYLLVSTPFHLFLVQAGLGIAAALAIPTWEALYDTNYENKKHEGYVWGLAGGQAQIVTGIAIIIGGLIVNYFSFRILFITMGIIQIIATIYQAQILKSK